MKKLTKKQKIIGGIVIALLLVASLLYNSDLLRNRKVATEEDVKQLKQEENKDLHSITKYEPSEEDGKEELEEKEEGEKNPSGNITSFYISSKEDSVAPGGNLAFEGYFEGSGEFGRSITWTVQGAHHPDTGIGIDGVLKVSPHEKNEKLFIRGVSQYDGSKKAEKSVAVTQPEQSKPTTQNSTTTNPKTASVGKPKSRQELKQKAQEVKKQTSPEEIAKKEAAAKAEKAKAIAEDQKNAGKKDKYQTDPTPAGRPKPVEPGGSIDQNNPQSAYLSINCSTILDNMDLFDMDKIDVLPVDGVILSKTEVTFYPGESVYDLLKREMQNRKIHMESSFTPVYNSAYIEGINNLYEFDCGENSGWMFRVNGWFPNYGVSRYAIQPGDNIEFLYTCALGKDIGDNSMAK